MKKQARKMKPLLNRMDISVGAQLQIQTASVVVLVSWEQRVIGMPFCQQSRGMSMSKFDWVEPMGIKKATV
jgi:hypothetical protein